MVKLQDKSQAISLKDYYDALPYAERVDFRKKVIKLMGWTKGQWDNRLYGRTGLTRPECFLLEEITGCKYVAA